ncbi:MAG: amidohydrolase family protein [Nitrososphaeria archaeon]
MSILFKGRYILKDYLEEPIENEGILVNDGVIVDVGDFQRLKKETDEVVDLGDVIVAPSFANTHSHIAMVVLRGIGEGKKLHDWLEQVWGIEAKLDYELLFYANIVGIGELVSSGVTSFLDFYDVPPMLRALREIDGPLNARLGLAFMDKVPYMKEESWRRLKSLSQIRDDVRSQGYDLFVSPHSLYSVSEELLRELFRLEGYKYQIHFAENPEEVAEIKSIYNRDPVDVLIHLGALDKWIILAHSVMVPPEKLNELARPNVYISHCPVSNARLGSGVAPLLEMVRRGVNVTIGTDGAGSSETLDIFEEIRLANFMMRAVTGEIMSIKAIMKMASYGGHVALGVQAGKLLPGMNADFITYDLRKLYPSWDVVSSLAYQGRPEVVKDVVVKGRFIKKDGSLVFNELYKKALDRIIGFIQEKG